MKDDRKSITLNLRVELIDMLDALADEWHTLRPGVLERVIASEYRAAMKKRAQQFPTVAQPAPSGQE